MVSIAYSSTIVKLYTLSLPSTATKMMILSHILIPRSDLGIRDFLDYDATEPFFGFYQKTALFSPLGFRNFTLRSDGSILLSCFCSN